MSHAPLKNKEAIHCRTLHQFNEVKFDLEKNGQVFPMGQTGNWFEYQEKTVIALNNILTWGDIDFYNFHSYKIYTFEKFFEPQTPLTVRQLQKGEGVNCVNVDELIAVTNLLKDQGLRKVTTGKAATSYEQDWDKYKEETVVAYHRLADKRYGYTKLEYCNMGIDGCDYTVYSYAEFIGAEPIKAAPKKPLKHVCVATETVGQFQTVLDFLRENGARWNISTISYDESIRWDQYKEETCVEITTNNRVNLSPRDYYEKQHFTIIPFCDFFKLDPKIVRLHQKEGVICETFEQYLIIIDTLKQQGIPKSRIEASEPIYLEEWDKYKENTVLVWHEGFDRFEYSDLNQYANTNYKIYDFERFMTGGILKTENGIPYMDFEVKA